MMNNRTYYSREAEERARREKMGIAWAALLGGLSLGALLMLLFAPQAGRITRKMIEDSAERALDDGRDTGNKVIGNVREGFEKARKEVEDRVEKIR